MPKVPRVLYTSAEIHTQIKRLLGQPSAYDRRVALVAYVGTDGEKYLPHPDGLRLICNPSAGGTDPDTLRRLLKRGARVEISERLHMKVYWSENRGCVITSANASSNALGKGGLKEAGILLPSRAVDVNRLIRSAQPRTLQESDLHQLDKTSREQKKHASNSIKRMGASPDFLEWYSAPHRSIWKVAYIQEEIAGTARVVKHRHMWNMVTRSHIRGYRAEKIGCERVTGSSHLRSVGAGQDRYIGSMLILRSR